MFVVAYLTWGQKMEAPDGPVNVDWTVSASENRAPSLLNDEHCARGIICAI